MKKPKDDDGGVVASSEGLPEELPDDDGGVVASSEGLPEEHPAEAPGGFKESLEASLEASLAALMEGGGVETCQPIIDAPDLQLSQSSLHDEDEKPQVQDAENAPGQKSRDWLSALSNLDIGAVDHCVEAYRTSNTSNTRTSYTYRGI